MAVSARFEADFSQFVAATKGAEAALGKVVAGGAGVGRTFRGMEDGASTAAGRVDQFNLSISQASALLGRFGLQIPPVLRGLLDLGNLAAGARVGLAEVGAAAAPAAAGVAATGTAAGAAATGIGAMGTAAIAAGAALSGWTIGKWIGDVSGLHDTIADGTAKLLGWGDVAGQEAAAGADMLARASKLAGRAITDKTEAMRINQLGAELLIASNQKLMASEAALAAAAKETARVYESNRSKLQKLEHDLAVAQVTRREDEKAKYAEMQLASGKGLTTAQANSAAVREMETQFELERLRAHQEVDVQTSQRRLAAAGSAPAPFGGVPFAMRTPESYGGYTIPGGSGAAAAPIAAPFALAATSSSAGSARGFGAGTVNVYVTGVDPAVRRQLADAGGQAPPPPRVESMRRW